MQFIRSGQKIKLSACEGTKNQGLTEEKDQYQSKGGQTYFIQVVPWQATTQCFALNLEEETTVSCLVHALLDTYPTLLQEPTGLPPARANFDHTIPLKEGANPISIHPYRFPAMQKSVIEKLIEEMLNKGIILMSSSPLASPLASPLKINTPFLSLKTCLMNWGVR